MRGGDDYDYDDDDVDHCGGRVLHNNIVLNVGILFLVLQPTLIVDECKNNYNNSISNEKVVEERRGKKITNNRRDDRGRSLLSAER